MNALSYTAHGLTAWFEGDTVIIKDQETNDVVQKVPFCAGNDKKYLKKCIDTYCALSRSTQ